MRKLTVFTEGSTKRVEFDESLLILNENPHLFIKSATVFWDLNNVLTDENNKITYAATEVTFETGYWTFSLISNKLKSLGNITLEANKFNTCSITTDKTLD